MDFNEEGFIGDSIADFKGSVEGKHAQFFELYRKTNRIAHKMVFHLEIANNDGQKVIAAALFIRLLHTFQAVAILAQHGLMLDSKALLRGGLEALFILNLLCKEKEFLDEYIGSDALRRRKLFNVAADSASDPNFESLRNYAHSHPEFLEGLEEEIKKNGWKKLNTKELAERSGLISMYDTHYRLLSEEVHTVPRSLESLLGFTEDQTPSSFEWGPSDQELPFTLLTSVQMLLVGMKAISTLCGIYDQHEELLLEIDASLTELNQALSTLDTQ
ncbi:DUF5677 domain-containing protein [Candidatus Entotheonella palauensis]|uniref:DUF5677 domain-containing protein n=1 Tax=Candidatus Entotheonella palauensis TaxID=93172 RepID=UPI000B7CF5D8|nr:DUF5677 domain-containing protein [Candidatus Entotheonella palauensis]